MPGIQQSDISWDQIPQHEILAGGKRFEAELPIIEARLERCLIDSRVSYNTNDAIKQVRYVSLWSEDAVNADGGKPLNVTN